MTNTLTPTSRKHETPHPHPRPLSLSLSRARALSLSLSHTHRLMLDAILEEVLEIRRLLRRDDHQRLALHLAPHNLPFVKRDDVYYQW